MIYFRQSSCQFVLLLQMGYYCYLTLLIYENCETGLISIQRKDVLEFSLRNRIQFTEKVFDLFLSQNKTTRI